MRLDLAADTFCDELNTAVQAVKRLGRVRFEIDLGPGAEGWIRRKHANGAVHEPGTIAAFLAVSRRQDCKVIWDVGALYGYFTLVAVGIFQKAADITAFEMHEGCIRPLLRNVLSPGIRVVHAAVSDRDEHNVKIWVSGFNIFEEPEGGWGNLDKIPGAMKERGLNNRSRFYSKVDFLTLDSWGSRYGAPDLIKIDVEGFQAKAVQGALGMLKERRPIVIIELHDPEKLARFGTTNKATVQPFYDLGYRGYRCENFRHADATYARVTEMGPEHEKLSIMVFMP